MSVTGTKIHQGDSDTYILNVTDTKSRRGGNGVSEFGNSTHKYAKDKLLFNFSDTYTIQILNPNFG